MVLESLVLDMVVLIGAAHSLALKQEFRGSSVDKVWALFHIFKRHSIAKEKFLLETISNCS